MRVTKTTLIEEAIDASPKSTKARDLKAWLDVVRSSRWAGPADVRKDFPRATNANNPIWLFPLSPSGVTVEALVGFKGEGQLVIKQVHQ